MEREHGFFKNNRKSDNIHVFSDRLGETFVECNNVNSLQIRLNQEVFIIINVVKWKDVKDDIKFEEPQQEPTKRFYNNSQNNWD